MGFHQLVERWLKASETLLPNERGWANVSLTYKGPKVSLRWRWRRKKNQAVQCPSKRRKEKGTCPLLPSTHTHTGAQAPPGKRRYRELPNQKQLSDTETTPADAPAAPRPPKGCGWELVERGRGHLSTNNGLNRLLPSPRCGPQNSRPEESHTHWKVGPGPGPGPVPGIRRVSQGFGGGGGWDAISASSQLPLGTGTLQAPGHRPLERQAQLAERRALHPDRP